MIKLKILMLAGGAAIAFAAPAFAQDTETSSAPGTEADTPETIIVTARRREEALLDVPVSVTAVGGDDLVARGTDKIENLSAPSLSITNNGTNRKTAGFALRGQRTNESQLLTDPPVGTYFAEVVQPRPFGFGYTFYDISNVQVLKGVQGTLFGRNVTGGAVLVNPNEPTSDLEGNIKASVGNLDLRSIEGVFNLPFGEVGGLRVAGRKRKRDGYVQDIVNNQDLEDEDYDSLRASLALEFDVVENLTIVDWLRANENGSGPIGTGFRTGNLAAVPPGLGCLQAVQTGVLTAIGATECLSRVAGSPVSSPVAGYNASIARLGRTQLTVAGGLPTARQNGIGRLAFSNLKNWGVTNRTVFSINDNLQLKNIFGYRDIDFARLQDLDGISSFLINSIQETHLKQYSEELQLQGTAFENRLNFTLGGYYFKESGSDASSPSSQFPELTLGGAAAVGAGNLALSPAFQGQVAAGLTQALINRGLTLGSPAFTAAFNAQIGPAIGAAVGQAFPAVLQGTFAQLKASDFLIFDQGFGKAETYAAYAAATYDFSDQFSVSGGIRYTTDKREARIVPLVARPGGVTACSYDPDGGGPLPVFSVANCQVTSALKNDAITWDATLQFKPSNATNAYISARRGFRSGGFSLRAKSNAAFAPFLPETVQEYEVGLKNSFSIGGGTLSTSLAGFFQDYKDVQKQVPQFINGAVVTVITNTTAQENYGAEFEASLNLRNGLTIDGYYSYVGAKIKSGGIAGAFTLQGVPHHQAGANVNFAPTSFPQEAGDLSFNANLSYKSRIHLDDIDLSADQPAYTIINLRIDWQDIYRSGIGLGIWANNVTNKRYRSGTVSLLDSAGSQASVYGEPQTYGMDISFKF